VRADSKDHVGCGSDAPGKQPGPVEGRSIKQCSADIIEFKRKTKASI